MSIIREPGKFEGETELVRELWLNSDDDHHFYDGETLVSCFKLTADDIAKHSDDYDADDVGKWLCLWESDQGFVNSALLTAAELDCIEAECEADAESEMDE